MSLSHIPEEMKNLRHWVCWRMGTRTGAPGKEGKPTKQPFQALNGRMAKSDDPIQHGGRWFHVRRIRFGGHRCG